MGRAFDAVQVSDHVYWVGAIDWSLRDFHGYWTGRGSTYNAYLVMADKITLVDTVKKPFQNELLDRIASVVDPADISYIVSNHAEMDHSGCLPEIIEAVRPEKVFASTKGVEALGDHFHMDYGFVEVKDGDSVSLGNMAVTFLETRMLHWPDSMVTYLAEDSVLFSQDGFGMHLASSERFADELPQDIIECETATYFANILMPYARLVEKLIGRIGSLAIQIDIIAPDHGPIWRENPGKVLDMYAKFAAQKPAKKAVILYDTMWGSTESMARAVSEGLASGGVTTKVMSTRVCHRSEVPSELLDAGALIVGSPTINNTIFPTLADILTYLKGLKPQNLIGAAFGSYGWSGEAVGQLYDMLEAMKIETVRDGVKVKYVPDSAALEQCRTLGAKVARTLTQKCGG